MMCAERKFRDEDDFRSRFAQLRREDEAHAPAFNLSPRRGTRRPGRSTRTLIVAAACVTTMAAALFILLVPRKAERPPAKPIASLAEWRAPTDFLLDTPGRDLLKTVPAIGASQDYSEALRPRSKSPQSRKHVVP